MIKFNLSAFSLSFMEQLGLLI